MATWHVPELHCPRCGLKITQAVCFDESKQFGPSPGDLSFCVHCLCRLKYIDVEGDRLGVDVLTSAEFETLPEKAQIGLIQDEARIAQLTRLNKRLEDLINARHAAKDKETLLLVAAGWKLLSLQEDLWASPCGTKKLPRSIAVETVAQQIMDS